MATRVSAPSSPWPGWRSAGWILVGASLFVVVAWVGWVYLGWLVFGLFTYYVGRPVTRRLRTRVPSGSLAAGLTLLFIIIPIVAFIGAFLSVALGQAATVLSSDAAADLVTRLPFVTAGLPDDPVDLIVQVAREPTVSTALGQFGTAFGAVATTLFNLFLTLIFAFFLLAEDARVARWFETRVFGVDSTASTYLRAVDRGLTSVYFGYTLTIFAIMVLAAVIYGVFNVVSPGDLRIPAVILLAVVTGLFTLIPLVGRSIVYAFIVALLSVQAIQTDAALLWIPALFFVLMVLVFDNVVRTYIRPYLSGQTYHMGLVMFAYLLGPVLFGWYGIFLGPLLMVLVVEFLTNVLPRFTSTWIDDAGVAEEPRPPHEATGEAPDGDEPTDTGAPSG